MGYVTQNSAEMMGKAALRLWKRTPPLGSGGAATVAGRRLRSHLLRASGQDHRILDHGPEELRTLAAAAVSDPSAVTLPATQEKVQPLVEQIYRGAQDFDRRQTLAQPVLRLLSRAKWTVPKTVEQQETLYGLLIPKHTNEPSAEELARVLEAAANAVKPMGQLDPTGTSPIAWARHWRPTLIYIPTSC